MTLVAPRSRQGKSILVLAILAAVLATVGALFWANSAQATLPAVTVAVTDSGTATVTQGSTFNYIATVTVTGTAAETPTTTFTVDLSDNLTIVPANITLGTTILDAPCTVSGTNVVTCTDPTASAENHASGVITIPVTASGTGAITAPTACSYDDGAAAPNGPSVCTVTATAATITAGVTVAPATNFPGIPHTFDFALAIGWTCESDTGGNNAVDCGTIDVTTGGTVPCTVSAPAVTSPSMADPSTVSVTVTPTTGAAGTCTVGLAVKYMWNPGAPPTVPPTDDTTACCSTVVTATKTYSAAVAGGTLCHLDLPDAATEDAAGNTDGILYEGNDSANNCMQDDVDDAQGSFHAACIEGSDLTYAANGADITWSITPVAGGPAPASVQGFAGPNDEPCVMWGAGSTGTQQITATYAPGAPSPAVNYYWNEYCVTGGGCFDSSDVSTTDGPLPLIKEWNTIDFTKIVGTDGDVGDTLADNTLGLDDWTSRDCVNSGLCASANLDGTTRDISGVLRPDGQTISANGASFIDYTMGSHNDVGGAYSGPVDGASQTYTVSGDCGSVRLEDPTTGAVHVLEPGDAATVLSSDKGVGFQVLPNDANDTANCQPDSCVTVTIDTEEANLFHSPPLLSANEEVITVCFHVGPPTNKQPLLAWAGQRVVLEHDWSFTDQNGVRSCPFDTGTPSEPGNFFVRYVKESGNGALISDLGHGAASGPDFMVVEVSPTGDSNVDPEDNCISRVIYESQDQGEQDVVAHVVECLPADRSLATQADGALLGNVDPDTCSVVSEQVAFLAFYMKFEDITLKLLPDATTHDSPPTVESSAVSPPAGEDSTAANVSANVLARATVRGWVLADNCPARDSAVGSNGEFIPANRCIFPDDWNFKAGGAAAIETRPNYDIYGGSTSGCSTSVAGPFSQLDPPESGNRLAPYAGGGQRETNFPDGVINADDAPMPSALIRFELTGSGFLMGASKANPNAQFDVTHIPAEPWISPTNADLSGYQWNSWGTGPKSGVYHYWTDFASHGPEVLSCGRDSSGAFVPGVGDPDPCGDGSGVPTGGYDLTKVYSDEHGNAMTWINGDANLDFSECANSVASAGHQVVLLQGFYCQADDVVGSSTLNALADYPDKRKHFAILSSDVTIDWTWGGIKEISVEDDPADATGQYHYVVLHVTDRDGFCGTSPSLHPVLGEQVDFRIDSTSGTILPDVNGNSAEGPAVIIDDHGKSATTHTFDTGASPSVQDGGWTVEPVVQSDPAECQAWIHVSESLLNQVDVIVTAFDPEGTVTFDTKDINPTPVPTPTPSPTPEPTPVTFGLVWGDTDCGGTVAPRDGQAILKRILELPELSVNQPCPGMGQEIIIGGTHYHWADFDCDGTIAPRDGQAILKNVLQLTALSQTEPCPDVGSTVQVQVVSLP